MQENIRFFDANPCHNTSGLGGGTHVLCMEGRVSQQLFDSRNFATSAALAEVCALLNAILVSFHV